MDVDEFERFFAEMRPRLLRYASRWTGADAADDLAMQTLAAVWDKNLPAPADGHAHARLESLSFRICEGMIRNHLRARARWSRLLIAIHQDDAVRTNEVESPEAALVAGSR